MSHPRTHTTNRESQFRTALLLGFLVSIALLIVLFAPRAAGSRQGNANQPVSTQEAPVSTKEAPVSTQEARVEPSPLPTIEAEPTGQLPYIIKTGTYATWNYTATWVADGAYVMETTYDMSSVGSIKAFAAENRQLAATLMEPGESVQVKVTFRRAIAPEEYRSWAQQTGFVPSMGVLRYLDMANTRGGAGFAPEGDDVIPEAYIRPERFQPGGRLQGVFIALGTITTDRLRDLVGHKDVFLADVTPAIVRNEIAQMVGNSEFSLEPAIDSPFWFMENYGLENFQE